MFLGETRYLTWANREFPRAKYDLASSGEPTRAVHPSLVRSPNATLPDLTRAIARHVDRDVAEVSLALGASHAIFLAYAALLGAGGQGSHVLVEHPFYEPLARVPVSLGADVTHFERRLENGYQIDLNAVLAGLKPNTNVVAISNLHNPTGVRTSAATLERLARALHERNVFLLVDEAYAPFDARCNDEGIFVHSARTLGDNIVALSTLTKAYGYGPERIGWVLGPPDLTRAIEHQVTTQLGLLPRAIAPIGVAILENLAKLRGELVPHLPERRALVKDWVASHPRLSWTPPDEGVFGLVHVAGETDLRSRIEKGLVEHEVLVSLGEFFGVPDAFRLSWARPIETVREGLSRLTLALGL